MKQLLKNAKTYIAEHSTPLCMLEIIIKWLLPSVLLTVGMPGRPS